MAQFLTSHRSFWPPPQPCLYTSSLLLQPGPWGNYPLSPVTLNQVPGMSAALSTSVWGGHPWGPQQPPGNPDIHKGPPTHGLPGKSPSHSLAPGMGHGLGVENICGLFAGGFPGSQCGQDGDMSPRVWAVLCVAGH